jgi:Zn-finger nucleic acid-binding protein
MCPVCHIPLLTFEWSGVELDRCDTCGGTWLDAGELEILVEPDAGPDPVAAAIRAAVDAGKTTRKCPRCGKRLAEARVDTRPGVVLDHCTRCRGLWFDRGEMEHLMEVFGNTASPTARFLADLGGAGRAGGAKGE